MQHDCLLRKREEEEVAVSGRFCNKYYYVKKAPKNNKVIN